MPSSQTVEPGTSLHGLLSAQLRRARQLDAITQRGIWHLLKGGPDQPLALDMIARADAPADLLAEYAKLTAVKARVAYLSRPEHTGEQIIEALGAETRTEVLVRLSAARVHTDAVRTALTDRFLVKPNAGLAQELLQYDINSLPEHLVVPLWDTTYQWWDQAAKKNLRFKLQELTRRTATLDGAQACTRAEQVQNTPGLLVMFAGCPDLPEPMRICAVRAMAKVPASTATAALGGLLSVELSDECQALLDQIQARLDTRMREKWRVFRSNAAAASVTARQLTAQQRMDQADAGNVQMRTGLILDPDAPVQIRAQAARKAAGDSPVYSRLQQLPEPVLDALVTANPEVAAGAGVWQLYHDPGAAQARAVSTAMKSTSHNAVEIVLRVADHPAAVRAVPWYRVPGLAELTNPDYANVLLGRIAALQRSVLGDDLSRWEVFAGLSGDAFDGTFGDLLDAAAMV